MNTVANKMEDSNVYTLITGGSHGIGLAMVHECARLGDNLLIVALDEVELYQIGEEIAEKYGVRTDCLGIDLTEPQAPETVFEWCQTEGYVVNRLINNAGFGRSGLFHKIDVRQYIPMMRLNNEVLVKLNYYFLPSMLELPAAQILNMSSIEANMPNPYKAVYTGTKNFVYAFTLALREELKATNVTVSVLCPGPTLTNEDGLKRVKAQGWKAKVLLLMPDEVAKPAIEGMRRGEHVIVPGWRNGLLNRIMYLLPTKPKMAIMEKLFRKYKDEGAS